MEVERKFLVSETPIIKVLKKYHISQGYLSYDPEIRIRKKNDKCTVAKKGDGTLTREEYEQEISEEAYQILLPLVQGNLIVKERIELPIGESLKAELDVYNGALTGLKVVEVEFPTEEEAQKFVPLEWFLEEVTEDERYNNKNLAKLDNLEPLRQINFEECLKKVKKKTT